jgi:hypothetical protein
VLHSSCARCGCCGLAEKPETSERGPSGKKPLGTISDGLLGSVRGAWLGWWERSLDCCVCCVISVLSADAIESKRKENMVALVLLFYFSFRCRHIWRKRERDHHDYTPMDNTSRVTVLQLITQTDLNLLLCLVSSKGEKRKETF